MSIILGSDYIYNKNLCDFKKYILTVPLSKILKQIKKVLLSLNIEVVRPLKTDLDICRSLWVRDSIVNINNKLLLLPLHNFSDRSPLEWRSIPVKGKQMTIFPNEEYDLEGGDIIQDVNTIFLGINGRTNRKGLNYIKDNYKGKTIAEINHTALHLDCCFLVLPNEKIIYSKRYISNLPDYIKTIYECISIETIIGTKVDSNLATNILIIGNNLITTNQPKFKKFREYLTKQGYNVIEINYGTFWRYGGGIRCLTQWINVPSSQKII
jgi:N-dimethylarginine dimethylaminohydrolase